MNDPHVEWLEYELEAGWEFDKPPSLPWTTAVFHATLGNGILRVELLEHYATELDAKAAVEPFLQSWELDVALTCGRREMTFAYKHASVVDRNPPPPGVPIIGMAATSMGRASMSATGTVTRTTYPLPPTNFKADPDVLTLWGRYEGYKAGLEPLASMAYFCFTLLASRHGKVGAVSKALAVSQPVLRKISELSTTRGDASTARKMTPDITPFATAETQWLDAALRAIIRRVGETAAGHKAPQLTFSNLPPLEISQGKT
ncbi:MAG: hypothetical protein HY858_13065 [Candidatus Solibacter usitatus]|nr:hypothetical protein [Candidatus Solibacter usitatus]